MCFQIQYARLTFFAIEEYDFPLIHHLKMINYFKLIRLLEKIPPFVVGLIEKLAIWVDVDHPAIQDITVSSWLQLTDEKHKGVI
jgi:hypothetical protein